MNTEIILDPKSETKLVYDRTTGDVVVMRQNVERMRITAAGLGTLVSSEARGDILRRGAAAWERLAAATSGQILVGDGTDIASVAVSGDATLSSAGALTVTDVTVGSDAAGDVQYKSSATALARLAKGTAAQVMLMNAGATAPSWASMSGDTTITAAGVVAIGAAKVLSAMMDERLVRTVEVTISSAAITGAAAGQLAHANGFELVATPGVDKCLEVLSVAVVYDYATAAYGAGSDMSVRFAGTAISPANNFTAANSFGAAADKALLSYPNTGAGTYDMDAAKNLGINLIMTAAAFTQPGTAAGVARIRTAYRVHDLGLD